MNVQRTKLLTGLAIVIGLVSAIAVVWAGSVQIPIQGVAYPVTIDPGRQWTDEDGVLHIRGIVQTQYSEGQDENGIPFVMNGELVANLNLDLATGNGDATFHITYHEVTYGDLHGSFEGTGRATYTGFVAQGEWNNPQGGGDFAGWHSRGTYTRTFGAEQSQWEGILHNPHGD